MARIYQVDAFTDRLFGGNPAAVVLLDAWLDDEILQSIGAENNLAETAFVVPVDNRYELRWFTPSCEVALCGHATLASAHVLLKHEGVKSNQIDFVTRQSGTLSVKKASNEKLSMSFPSIALKQSTDRDLVACAIGATPHTLLTGHYTEDEFDYVAVFNSPDEVASIESDKAAFVRLKSRGVIVTSSCESSERDFVSRYFAPNFGIDEDPVTGSAHCLLAPYWGHVLNKDEMIAHQVSARGGVLGCLLQGERTILTGSCVDYLQGEIELS